MTAYWVLIPPGSHPLIQPSKTNTAQESYCTPEKFFSHSCCSSVSRAYFGIWFCDDLWQSTNAIYQYLSSEQPVRHVLCSFHHTLQRNNTENSKQIFPEKELRGCSPNSNIHVSVIDLYIPLIGLPILLRWSERGNICIDRSQTHECWNWVYIFPWSVCLFCWG
jgi:hypothetical protein